MRTGRFVIERHRHVIDPLVAGAQVIGIIQRPLNGRANPGFGLGAERRERIDPGLRILVRGSRGGSRDLRPASILMEELLRAQVEVAQICRALDTLRPGAEARKHGKTDRDQNRNDSDDDTQLEERERAAGELHAARYIAVLAGRSCEGGRASRLLETVDEQSQQGRIDLNQCAVGGILDGLGGRNESSPLEKRTGHTRRSLR
jgi:hypothetical protein